MALEIVLNEHSFIAPNVDTARAGLVTLAKTIKEASKKSGQTVDLWRSWKAANPTLAQYSTGLAYTLSDFFADPLLTAPEQDARKYLLILLGNKSSFWDVPPEPTASMSARKITSISACKPGSHSWAMCGLGFAFVRQALVVSLPSSSTWKCKNIHLPVKVTPPGIPTSATVQHASDPSHI